MGNNLRIKLVRWGFSKRPFYILSVMQKRQARNSGNRFEDVGWWDPNQAGDGNMHLGLKMERIKYWLTAGAQPTDTVAQLLGRAGLIPQLPQVPWKKPLTENDDIKWRSDLQKQK